jgi:hypothetical protein
MLLKWAFTRQLPKLDKTNTTIGFVLMLPALYFFVVGLEDTRDWFVFAFTAFVIYSELPDSPKWILITFVIPLPLLQVENES